CRPHLLRSLIRASGTKAVVRAVSFDFAVLWLHGGVEVSAGHKRWFGIGGVVALTAVALVAIPAAAAGRSCGTVHVGRTTGGESWSVGIARGSVSCAQARAAVKN